MLTDLDIKFLNENIPFYKKLSYEEKAIFDSNCINIKFNENHMIHIGENECSGMIIIKQGVLRAFLNSNEGKEITIYKLFNNDICILSASCIFKNINFNINLQAIENTEVLILPSKYVQMLSNKNPALNNYILELTQSKFSEVMWIIEQIVFTSFDKRLINYLEEFRFLGNSPILKITHDTIAKDLGTAREVVSRMLKYFEKEGMVKLSRGTIEIINLNRY